MNELLNGPFFFTGLCLIVYLLACRLQWITRKTSEPKKLHPSP